MSEKPDEWDRSRDEIISGEYVLGVLSATDRKKVEARMAVDPRFAQQVRRWERNLQPFNDDYEDIRPPAAVLNKIEARLFGEDRAATAASALGWWNSLALWRGLAFGALVIAAGLGLYNVGSLYNRPESRPLVAELTGETAGLRLLAAYDSTTGQLSISPAAATSEQPKSLEVWLIEDGKDPASLGILAEGERGTIEIPADMRSQFDPDKTIAITLEDFGGSPDGKPHGSLVAAGKMRLL